MRAAARGPLAQDQVMSELVQVTRAEGVCEIRLNRPEKRNAITFAMYAALSAPSPLPRRTRVFGRSS